MMIFLTIVVFVLLFGVIIFVHEFGHFLAAKRLGVRVEEFAFGFPPRLFGKKIGETTYAINLIPLGGYVKMLGEDGQVDDPHSFSAKTPSKRAIILVAGVLMNALLAWIIISGLLILPDRYKLSDAILVAQVQSGSPAEKAGLQLGDIIKSVADTHPADPSALHDITSAHAGQTVAVVIQRNGHDTTQSITLGQGDAPLGVAASSFSLSGLPHPPWWKAPWVGLEMIWQVIVGNIVFLWGLAGSILGFGPHVSSDQVSGPVGIYGIIAQFTALGWAYVLFGAAQLSLAIAIFNILPIPALDGGRLLFVVVNGVSRRKVLSEKSEGVVHSIGFALLIALFVFVTYRDIVKLFH